MAFTEQSPTTVKTRYFSPAIFVLTLCIFAGLEVLPLGLPLQLHAADWPRFLGVANDCKAAAEDVTGFWPEAGFVKDWEFPKGKGWSCPAVAGDRTVIFYRVGSQEVLDCLELKSGKSLWKTAYEAPYRDRYGSGDGTKSNPVIAGGMVYVLGITGLLHGVDLQTGAVVWKRNLHLDYGMRDNFFGHGSTPLVLEGKVIAPVGGDDDRCVVALDASTGREIWVAKHAWGAGYASAIPVFPGGVSGGGSALLLFTGGESRPATGGLLCIQTATGTVLGEVSHRARIAESVNASSPVLVEKNRVFTTEAYGSGGVLSEIGADGSLRKLWGSSRLGAQFHTPVARDGLIFGFDGQNPRLAELVCLDAKTGDEQWHEDFGGNFGRGSLVDLGEAGLLVLGEFGELIRFKPGSSKAEVLQRTRLFDAPETWTPPVLANRRLLVMQNERGRDGSLPRLLCFRGASEGK
jgi:outer membrane protein assembly factor BamB